MSIDFTAINAAALSQLRTLVTECWPNGHFEGVEYVGGGTINGGPGSSFKVNTQNGRWADFGGNEKGRDVVSLYAAFRGTSQSDAARYLAQRLGVNGAAGNGKAGAHRASGDLDVEILSVVPPNAPNVNGLASFLKHKKLGDKEVTGCVRFDYRDADGFWRFSTFRFDYVVTDDGTTRIAKDIFPAVVGRKKSSGRLDWYSKWLPKPRTLYALDLLAKRPDCTALLHEGEAKTDAANALPDFNYVSVSFSAGANRVGESDFGPLADASVILFPDNDAPGFQAMIDAARLIESEQTKLHGSVLHSVRFVCPAPTWPDGYDIKNLIKEEHWDAARLGAFIEQNLLTFEEFRDYAAQRTQEGGAQKADPFKGTVASAVKRKPVEWYWRDHVAFGKLTDVQGDPDKGKTLVVLTLAAIMSSAGTLPNGEKVESGKVLFFSDEDGGGDTLVPRLTVAGAVLDNIKIFSTDDEGDPPTIPDDTDRLEATIREFSAKLVVFDPLDSFLSEKINTISNQSIRRCLSKLARLANRTNAAIIVIRHLNKDSKGTKAMYRGGGSIGMNGAARDVLLSAEQPGKPGEYALASVKNNLGLPPPLVPTEGFKIEAVNLPDVITAPVIRWTGVVPLSADDLLRGEQPAKQRGPQPSKREAAMELILEELADHLAHLSKPILEEGKRQGLSYDTMMDAADACGVTKFRDPPGRNGLWYWQLPQAKQDEEEECF